MSQSPPLNMALLHGFWVWHLNLPFEPLHFWVGSPNPCFLPSFQGLTPEYGPRPLDSGRGPGNWPPPHPIIPAHSICKSSRLWRLKPPSPHVDTSCAPTPQTSFPPTPAYRNVLLHHSAGKHDACTGGGGANASRSHERHTPTFSLSAQRGYMTRRASSERSWGTPRHGDGRGVTRTSVLLLFGLTPLSYIASLVVCHETKTYLEPHSP